LKYKYEYSPPSEGHTPSTLPLDSGILHKIKRAGVGSAPFLGGHITQHIEIEIKVKPWREGAGLEPTLLNDR
jgi:hypothetical protein